MGTLLNFQIPPRDSKPVVPGMERGKLLLFTGVRYERTGKDDVPDPPARRVRSRHRS